MKLRVAFCLTAILGVMYAGIGLLDSHLQLGIGLVLASVGVIGYGAIDWIER